MIAATSNLNQQTPGSPMLIMGHAEPLYAQNAAHSKLHSWQHHKSLTSGGLHFWT